MIKDDKNARKNMKINKILGKRGRITIPYEFRIKMGFRCNDVISFEEQDDMTIIIRHEKICDVCKNDEKETVDNNFVIDNNFLEFFDGLSGEAQRAVLIQLYAKWACAREGIKND